MNKQILIRLIIFCLVLKMNAQIYGTVAGTTGNNNIGIGIISPNAKLEVNGFSKITRPDVGTTYLQTEVGDVSTIFNGQDPDGYMHYSFNSNNNTRFFINGQTGNLGIGTISPNAKLEVNGFSKITRPDVGTTYLQTEVGDVSTVFNGQDPDGYMHYSFNSNNNTRFFINGQTGNVGIGITNPNANLQIGSSTVNGLINLGGYSHIGSLRSSGDLFTGTNVFTEYGSSDENSKIKVLNNLFSGFTTMQMSGNGEINFFANNTNPGINQQINIDKYNVFKIASNKNIGIGTVLPKYKLDVCGTIRATEIKVDLLGTCVPDFVFKKDYKLMNLNELEKFVTTKQHLPEIASEKEMIENGLNMKEFQMKLLQKMEEMTLYIIQQNKKLEKQNQEFEKLKTKIKKLESNKR
jgi:hypothetical protein